MIDDGEDAIVSSTHGKARDQIHCYLCERRGIFGDGDFVSGDACSVGEVLVLLTLCAPLDVCFDPGLHSRPVVQGGYFSEGLVSPRVPAVTIVIMVEDHSFELVIGWHDESLLVVVPEAFVGVEVLSFKPPFVGFLGGNK